MRKCPRCKSGDIHRSRAKSKWENWRKRITNRRPYRCRACGWRGWAFETESTFTDAEREAAERAIVPELPNLQGTTLARDESNSSEMNLKALDVIEMLDDRLNNRRK